MPTARNDFTGDALRTKPSTQKYRDNWDKIFGKKKQEKPRESKNIQSNQTVR